MIEGLAFTALLLYMGYRSPEAQAAIRPMLNDWNKFDDRFKYHAALNGFGDLGGGVAGWEALKAIALNESDLGRDPYAQPGVWSRDGKSRGLMQLILPTANDFEAVTPDDLDNPEISIRIAAKFFAQNWRRFRPSLEYTIKAYNQGGGATAKEMRGEIAGHAAEYWNRFQRNLKTVQENRG